MCLGMAEKLAARAGTSGGISSGKRLQFANWKMATEIGDFPITHGDFPSLFCVFTRGYPQGLDGKLDQTGICSVFCSYNIRGMRKDILWVSYLWD